MPRPLRYAAVSVALLVFTNGPVFFVARNLTADSGGWEGDLIRSAIVAAALLAAAIAAADLAWKGSTGARRAADPAGQARSPGPAAPAGLARPHGAAAAAIAAYTLAAIASTAWSVAPGLTLWRSLAYAGLALLAWVMADMGAEARAPLGLMTAAAVGASLLALVAVPNQAFDIRGYWRGVYITRNSLAPLAALGLLVALHCLLARPGDGTEEPPGGTDSAGPGRRHRRAAAGTALGAAALATLIGAGSRTAWLSLAGALAVSALGLAWPRLRQRFGPRAAAAAGLGAAAAGLAGLAAVAAALWPESTFAQRRAIWELVWDRIADRPIVGHGFFAFWEVPELTAAHELLQAGSAHNSILEVLLGTGLIGLAAFAVIAAAAALNAGRDLMRNPSADTWLWAAVVAFALFENTAESFVLWFSYNWVIIMAAALRCPGPRRPPVRLGHRGSGAKAQAPA